NTRVIHSFPTRRSSDLAPIGKFFYNISMKVSDFFASVKNIGKLETENEELKNRVIELEEQNRKYEDLIGKSDYLKNEAELMKKRSEEHTSELQSRENLV